MIQRVSGLIAVITLSIILSGRSVAAAPSSADINQIIEQATRERGTAYTDVSKYLRQVFARIRHLQIAIEHCMKKRGMVKGCDAGHYGIIDRDSLLTDEEKQSSPVSQVQIKDGVITINPNPQTVGYLTAKDSLIATPAFANGRIKWSYSGGILQPVKNVNKNGVDTCPKVSEMTHLVKNHQTFFNHDIKWLVSIPLTNKPITALPSKDLVFDHASDVGSIACIYLDKSKREVVFHSTLPLSVKPSGGFWAKQRPRLCSNPGQKISVADCPFKIKRMRK